MSSYFILQTTYVSSHEITINALKDSDVYICCYDYNHELKSQLQQLNFKTKEEEVRDSYDSLSINHKKMLSNEIVKLTGTCHPYLAIFVR